MLLDIDLIEESGMICQDMAYATAANYLGRRYELMFKDAWGFEFSDQLVFKSLNPKEYDVFNGYDSIKQQEIVKTYKDAIGRRISVRQDSVVHNLKAYHGIEVVFGNPSNKEAYIEEILSQLEKQYPVDLWFNQYFMPWTKKSRKVAPMCYQGYLMLTGYNEQQKAFHCIDIHGTRTKEMIPLAVFEDFIEMHHYFNYTTYRVIENEKPILLNEYIEETVKRITGEQPHSVNMFEEMRKCAQYIKSSFDFQKEIELSHISKGKLAAPTHILCVKSLVEVARMRNLYAVTLNYLGQRDHNARLIELSRVFNLYATKWQIMVSILVKAFYNKDYTELPIQLSNYILSIVEEEEKGLEELIAIQKAGNTLAQISKEKKQPHECTHINEIKFYNLRPYMNNKGICCEDLGAVQADFDGLGNYYLLKQRPINNILEDKMMMFKLNLVDEENDNVICEGQYLEGLEDSYSYIAFLGACDSGAFYGKIEIIYQDDFKEEVIFGFGEWRFGKCEFKEKLAFQCERVYMNVNSPEAKGYIFSKTIGLRHQVPVKAIRLPACPNMHIFALSLIK